ncbi:hypothetical protein Agub_g8957 [Astrephomene gubernaculifera]|uniref:Leucine-rich repeat-containing N-terminal plant-type domain-containing protein n=1 Tax=Astrephomene gubernaculifera TaxID=47775 RepID=A0AAD3HNY4_9CHLO|nr:hypothetical protein Agub_g8957 [Astrephomene gubernaculifera]
MLCRRISPVQQLQLLAPLLLLLLPLPALGQQVCLEAAQRNALLSFYSATGGPAWIRREKWNTSETCTWTHRNFDTSAPLTSYGTVDLPSHCCWDGVKCCVSEVDVPLFASCTQYQCNCTIGLVTGLAVGRNGLTGRLEEALSPAVLQDLGCELRLLFLGGNALSGPLPEALTGLPDLRLLTVASNRLDGTLPASLSRLSLLEELDLSSNRLTGSVPRELCGGNTRFSPLRDLMLSNNNLTGELNLLECDSLINLDMQNNNLYGNLPDFSSYRQLHILRLGNNSFSGPISPPPFDLRMLVVLDLSDNYLTGTIPNLVGNGSHLTLVRLYGNLLTGSVPADIFSLGSLGNVMLQNNKLAGTLPENIGSRAGQLAAPQ